MVSHRLFDELLLCGLLWLCVLLYGVWQRSRVALGQSTPTRGKRATRRPQETKPVPGLMPKPHGPAGEHAAAPTPWPPASPPPLIVSTPGGPRQVDVQHQFCPNPDCSYSGWMGRGHLRANGHPGRGRWRPWHCARGKSYVLETYGTLLHGTRVSPERLVWAVGALVEGLGIRAVPRVLEVDPPTVLQWFIEAAKPSPDLLAVLPA